MKNVKRLFTLLMALTMVLSCTAVASAAELPENDDVSVVQEIASIDDGIMPLTSEYLVRENGMINRGATKTYTSNTVQQTEDVWLFFNCDKLCRIEVYVKAGWQSALLYSTDVEGGGSISRGITATLPKGAKIQAKIIGKEDNCSYSVTLRGSY